MSSTSEEYNPFLTMVLMILTPGSNAVLHMSRTQFNQLGSCVVRRLTHLSSTDFNWSGWGVLHAWQPGITPEDRLWVKRWSSHESKQTHNQRSKGAILTLPWKTTEQDCFCYLFGVADRLDWIKFDVWLKQAFFNYLSRPNLSSGSAHVK